MTDVNQDGGVNTPLAVTATPPRAFQQHGELGLLDVVGIVRRHKALIAFGLLAALALGALYFYRATPMYESQIRLLVMPKDLNVPTQGIQNGSEFQSPSIKADLLSTHVELFASPRIVGQAVQKYKLASLPSLAEAKNPVKAIIAELTVSKGGDGRTKDAQILCATYRGPSPEDCETILNAIVASYQDFLGETFEDTSTEVVELITSKSDQVAAALAQCDKDYELFLETSPLIWKGEETSNAHMQQLAQITADLSEVQLRSSEIRARLEVIQQVIQLRGAGDLSELEKLALLSDRDVQRLSLLLSVSRGSQGYYTKDYAILSETTRTQHQRLLTLLLQEQTLLRDYGDGYPELQEVRTQIQTIKQFLEDEGVLAAAGEDGMKLKLTPSDVVTTLVRLMQNDLSELQKRETDLQQMAKREEEAARKVATFELKNETLTQERIRQRELYDAILERLGEINLVKDYGGFLTEVISPVEVPTAPVAPNLVMVMGAAGVLGLFLGAALAYLAELTERTFRTPEELHAALGLPIVGHIPELATRNGKASPLQQPQISPTIVVLHQPASRKAEAFRGLRTALFFSSQNAGGTVIQVTSASPGDGKTTMAANLAVSIAQSGKRVLLVDADLRRPRVHTTFGIDTKVGLSSVIAGEAELPDVIHDSQVEHLSILPVGTRPPNPAEMLTSPTFSQFVRMVREQYDFVIIDTPPVVAVSDPCIIAPMVDGVLLTVRVVKNGRPAAIQAREMLAGVGAKVLGVVVNGFHQDHSYGKYGNGEGYRYGYSYGYGQRYGGKNGSSDDHYYTDENGNGTSDAEPKSTRSRTRFGKRRTEDTTG